MVLVMVGSRKFAFQLHEYLLPDNVLQELSICLESKPKQLGQLLYFLAQVDTGNKFVQILEAVLSNPSAFRKIVDNLVQDTEKYNQDPEYLKFMADIWNCYLKPNEKEGVEHGQEFNYQLILSSMGGNTTQSIMNFNFVSALSRLPPSAHRKMIATAVNLAESTLPSSWVVMARNSAENSLQLARSSAGKLMVVSLVAVSLAYDVYNNICRWWRGDISKEHCIKICIDDFVGAGAGLAGGFAGMTLGTAVLPGIGTVVGGNYEDWHKLQYSMAVVKVSKGEI